MINESRSFFRRSSFVAGKREYVEETGWRARFFALLPELSQNWVGVKNQQKVCAHAKLLSPQPRILIIGEGVGYEHQFPGCELIRVGVSRKLDYIADAHDLPFPDASFDGYVIVAILEHVADPYRVIDEAARVLRPGGVIYSETPFIHPFHAAPHDLHRFTEVGHRRLHRDFEEISAGVAGGPGQALANTWQAFLLSLTHGRVTTAAAYVIARFSAFWLRYIDKWANNRPNAKFCANGFFFIGRKAERRLSDREVIAQFLK